VTDLQPDWSPWSPLTPTEGPYYGPNGGHVVVRSLGGGAVIDRGQVVSRTTFAVVLRSALTGRLATYTLLRWRVESADTPMRASHGVPHLGGRPGQDHGQSVSGLAP
jgi:hypothetical protein